MRKYAAELVEFRKGCYDACDTWNADQRSQTPCTGHRDVRQDGALAVALCLPHPMLVLGDLGLLWEKSYERTSEIAQDSYPLLPWSQCCQLRVLETIHANLPSDGNQFIFSVSKLC